MSEVHTRLSYVPIHQRTHQVLQTKKDKIEVHKANQEKKEEEAVQVRDEKYGGKRESA